MIYKSHKRYQNSTISYTLVIWTYLKLYFCIKDENWYPKFKMVDNFLIQSSLVDHNRTLQKYPRAGYCIFGRGSRIESESAWCHAGIIERFEKIKMAFKMAATKSWILIFFLIDVHYRVIPLFIHSSPQQIHLWHRFHSKMDE